MLIEAGSPPVIVKSFDQLQLPPVPSLVFEREGVSQTHLTINLSGLEPSRDPGDGKGDFQLREIHFDNWQGRTLRQEYPRKGEVTFDLNHDNGVSVSRVDWRYEPSLSEEVEETLLFVAALLGSGTNVPERAEVWPLLPASEGSYRDGGLIVLVGEDAQRALELQKELVAGGREDTEDTWKEAVTRTGDELFR